MKSDFTLLTFTEQSEQVKLQKLVSRIADWRLWGLPSGHEFRLVDGERIASQGSLSLLENEDQKAALIDGIKNGKVSLEEQNMIADNIEAVLC